MLFQFKVSGLQQLSFSLPKYSFFPKRVEFVGINIGINHNMPAKNKHELLRTWPKPKDIHEVAAFIGIGHVLSKMDSIL